MWEAAPKLVEQFGWPGAFLIILVAGISVALRAIWVWGFVDNDKRKGVITELGRAVAESVRITSSEIPKIRETQERHGEMLEDVHSRIVKRSK